MGNRKELVSSLQELREDNIRKQKRGLHFIVASVFIWVAVLGVADFMSCHQTALMSCL